MAYQMQCFIGIVENEHSPNEVQCFWSLGACHDTIDGRQRTKDPVTVHALLYSDAVITDNVHNSENLNCESKPKYLIL